MTGIGKREREYLREGLLKVNDKAKQRARTLEEIGKCRLRAISNDGIIRLLSKYLSRSPQCSASDEPASLLHSAARLELQAMPLTRLFIDLYENEGEMVQVRQRLPERSGFRYYHVRDAPESRGGLLVDVVAHICRAQALGEPGLPTLTNLTNLTNLKEWLLARHRGEAKPDAPWVSADWRRLRDGLAPQQPAEVHAYRLPAFVSLLSDLKIV
ncbi:hypothetical protein [Acidiferrobacter sp.]